MKNYVSLDKRSKKAQKEFYSMQRITWGELNPVTRSVPSGKVYNRRKEKRKVSIESGNGFDADFFIYNKDARVACGVMIVLTLTCIFRMC